MKIHLVGVELYNRLTFVLPVIFDDNVYDHKTGSSFHYVVDNDKVVNLSPVQGPTWSMPVQKKSVVRRNYRSKTVIPVLLYISKSSQNDIDN